VTFNDVLAELRRHLGSTVSVAIGNGPQRVAGFAGVLVGEEIPPDDINMPGARAFRIVPDGVSRNQGAHHSVILLHPAQHIGAEWQEPRILRIEQTGFRITVAVTG
jgi:hypothetical protein